VRARFFCMYVNLYEDVCVYCVRLNLHARVHVHVHAVIIAKQAGINSPVCIIFLCVKFYSHIFVCMFSCTCLACVCEYVYVTSPGLVMVKSFPSNGQIDC
jgi:hypothetical protein